jgi:hypothetical protein
MPIDNLRLGWACQSDAWKNVIRPFLEQEMEKCKDLLLVADNDFHIIQNEYRTYESMIVIFENAKKELENERKKRETR